jgi:hypothetical protein
MRGEKRADLLCLVGGKIVENDVNLPSARLRVHDLGEERQEGVAGAPDGSLADHFAGARVEGCIERQRAVTVVLEPVSLGAAGRERQHGSSRSSA